LAAFARRGMQVSRLQTTESKNTWSCWSAKAWGGSGSTQGRGACMCVVGERHLNIVGMKDKFKIHQGE
jgi:hypothetical protein